MQFLDAQSFRDSQSPTSTACFAISALPFRYEVFRHRTEYRPYIALLRCKVEAQRMLYFYCMARADIRVRVRPTVIRVRIAETGIRTVFSVSTPKTQLSFSSAYHLRLSAFKASLGNSKEAWKMDYQNLVALDSRSQYFNELSFTQPQAELRTLRPIRHNRQGESREASTSATNRQPRTQSRDRHSHRSQR